MDIHVAEILQPCYIGQIAGEMWSGYEIVSEPTKRALKAAIYPPMIVHSAHRRLLLAMIFNLSKLIS